MVSFSKPERLLSVACQETTTPNNFSVFSPRPELPFDRGGGWLPKIGASETGPVQSGTSGH